MSSASYRAGEKRLVADILGFPRLTAFALLIRRVCPNETRPNRPHLRHRRRGLRFALRCGDQAKSPQAHVAWLVEPGIHELLAADPAIDELILWPKAEWKQLWKEKLYGELFGRIHQFRNMLRAKQFDTAIDMQSLLRVVR